MTQQWPDRAATCDTWQTAVLGVRVGTAPHCRCGRGRTQCYAWSEAGFAAGIGYIPAVGRRGQYPGYRGSECQPSGKDRQLSPAHHGRATNRRHTYTRAARAPWVCSQGSDDLVYLESEVATTDRPPFCRFPGENYWQASAAEWDRLAASTREILAARDQAELAEESAFRGCPSTSCRNRRAFRWKRRCVPRHSNWLDGMPPPEASVFISVSSRSCWSAR
jgi:hypothetical protein